DGGDVFPRLRAVREHGADSADVAGIAGIHGAAFGNGVISWRRGDHVHDAGRRFSCGEGRHAVVGDVRVRCFGHGAVRDGGLGFTARLSPRSDGAHVAEFRAGVFVHPDQRVGVRL